MKRLSQRSLDPTAELLVMQKVIHDHNTALAQKVGSNFTPLQIKKTIFYTGNPPPPLADPFGRLLTMPPPPLLGYLLPPSTASHLLKSIPIPNDNGVKLLGHSILITARPASPQILSKVGGLGNKVDFDVIGWGHWENKVWAAIVKPANPDVTIHTGMCHVPRPTSLCSCMRLLRYSPPETNQPIIVLALRGRETRPVDAQKIKNWQHLPGGQTLRITTVVGEKLLLRIEEDSPEGE